MIQTRTVPQFFSYAFFLISQALFLALLNRVEINVANILYLVPPFLFFVMSVWISLWTKDLKIAFLSLIGWFCIGFLQFAMQSGLVEENVSLLKWTILFSVVALGPPILIFHRQKRFNHHPGFVTHLLQIFILYLFITCCFSAYPMVSLIRSLGFLAIVFFAFYFLPRQMKADKVMDTFVACVWWMSQAMVVINLLAWLGLVPAETLFRDRFQGIFDNPNGLGPWLNLSVMTSLAMASRRGAVFKCAAALSILVSLFLLFYCNSRANYLGLVIGVFVFLLFSRKKWVWVTFIALALIFTAFYQSYYAHPIIELDWTEHLRLESRYGPTTGRIDKWIASLEAVKENPWHGTGLGAQEAVADQYSASLAEQGIERLLFDNSYLNFLYETGYAGLALFLLWLFSSLVVVAKNCFLKQDPAHQFYSRFTIAVTLNLCTVAFFESFFGTVGNIVSLVFWVLLGLGTTRPALTE
ncbi:MAG: hypothetical protein COV74_06565 [Candidatus Omnitrophica bacterium CG11_big_fil_rev_8_21_14_0_20_45_26]|uniref:O-antigen ligase-related domain-containing protein n=1 Tax=Candidatus Abzuiibacterium crystallinum TaxID=1974748 RepID=A0A2H0LNH8_9BACT|nr:MAG: hypothetical protein COV74_06565 [Candidatus Omnitrophica bacterium CG11_big_fil_rev_8_21_14_0_20_45_26]PIW64737.1 MAG: hypothetical protein COW12_04960 [Candidatus Omnitrophica bacterium CG12_big_fil_rev_8_21_14_0_65_45_16]